MNISFSFSGYGAPHRILNCNKPRKKGQLWERKICKTCALYYNGHCDFCYEKFGLFRIKETHAACSIYRPKSK